MFPDRLTVRKGTYAVERAARSTIRCVCRCCSRGHCDEVEYENNDNSDGADGKVFVYEGRGRLNVKRGEREMEWTRLSRWLKSKWNWECNRK